MTDTSTYLHRDAGYGISSQTKQAQYVQRTFSTPGHHRHIRITLPMSCFPTVGISRSARGPNRENFFLIFFSFAKLSPFLKFQLNAMSNSLDIGSKCYSNKKSIPCKTRIMGLVDEDVSKKANNKFEQVPNQTEGEQRLAKSTR